MKLRLLAFAALACATNLAAAPDPKRLAKVTAELEAIERLGGDRLGYAETMLRFLGADSTDTAESRRTRPEVSAYDLFSGALAIRESLQTDSITPGEERGADVPVSTLKGPQTKSHDFKTMLKGRKVQQFALASHVPPDWFYAHFSSLSSALDFADYLNTRGGAFYNRASEAPVDTALKRRILQQLAIVENKDARIFYDAVVEEAALVSSDFFFSMGTDVSLVFRLRQRMLFEATMATYRKQFQAAAPDAKSEVVNLEGKQVQALATPDNRLRSYYVLEGDMAIISNSLPAIARLLRIAAKKEPALAAMDEFRYMRSVYPADTGSEDGFLYFSDAFIRRLVSAEVRIAEARRMNTAFRLANLEKLALFHRHLYGKNAENTGSLLAAVAKDKAQLQKLTRQFSGLELRGLRAYSPAMGSLGFLKPNLEAELKTVTAGEANHYREFVRRYSEFWREYFDPIGIRFKKTQAGMKAEICILPLIENSIYDTIRRVLAQKLQQHRITTIPGETLSLSATLELNNTRPFRSAGDGLEFVENLTGNVQLHVLDENPTVDFESGVLFEEFTRRRARPDILAGAIAWSLFHPLRLSIEARDSASAEALVRGLRSVSRNHSRWQTSFAYDYQYSGKTVTVFVVNIAQIVTFRFHTWIDGNQIHMTTTRDYAERFLSAKPQVTMRRGNVVGIYRPSEIRREKGVLVQGNAEAMQRSCFAHLGTVKLTSLVFPGEDLPSAFEKQYGFRPVCPVGGSYVVKDGNPSHTKLGTPAMAHNDFSAVETLLRDFFATQEFSVQFQFTPHGIMTEIETK
ncbi:MAG: hypothetical protein ACOY5B_14065 [Spirochaetota bacterium]